MPEVVLLYERSCPNVGEARENLLRAFSAAKLDATWREVEIDAPETPPEWRASGSPTVLIGGVDVSGIGPAEGATCRVYEHEGRLARAPSVDQIVSRLRARPPR
jgi:hypothetical protein